ncbi:MAG: methionyl-tRNA formyltransferase, partial [bacterium]|nr:methionyl-tRNA formyltransferase [bacterium]
MRVLFAGTPAPAIPSLEALAASGHEVVGVLTRPDARKGRGRTLHPSEVAVAARELGLPVFTPRTLRDPEAQDLVRSLGAEAAAVVAYGQLVPRALLDLFPWVNLHFSLLPRWRGAAPVQRAIAAGDAVTGACAFLLEEGLDTGPVLGRIERSIGPEETSGDVLADLATTGAPVLVDALDALAHGTTSPQPQPEEGVTLAPKVTVEEARVDWAAPTREVVNTIRAFTPAPGAWTLQADGARLK